MEKNKKYSKACLLDRSQKKDLVNLPKIGEIEVQRSFERRIPS